MSKLLKESLRKTVAGIVAFATILSLSGVIAFAPAAQAATAIVDGDLIKSNAVNSDGTPTYASLDVYIVKLVGAKKFKRLILNPTVFTSYGHLNAANIKTVDQLTMDSYKTSAMVRVDTDAAQKVFALVPNDDIGAKSWINVTTADFLAAGADPESIYTINSVDGGNYTAVADITTQTQVNTFLTLGTLPSTLPVTGTITVAVASDNPGSTTLTKGSVSNSVLSFAVTAPADGDVTLNSVKFKRTGVGLSTDYSNVYIYDGATRLKNGKSIASDTNTVEFSSVGLTIAKGTTKVLTVKADVYSSAGTGDVNNITIQAATDIVFASGTVSGSFPITGNAMSIGSQSVGTSVIANGPSVTKPTLGQTGAKVATVKITAGVNDISVKSLTLVQNGSFTNSNIKNLTIKNSADSAVLGTATAMAGDKVVLALTTPLAISKSQNKTLELYADLSGGKTTDTIRFYLEESGDIVIVDQQYGQNSAITNNFGSSTAYCVGTAANACLSAGSLQGGTITLVDNGPAAATVAKNSTNVDLFKFNMTSTRNVTVKDYGVTLEQTAWDTATAKRSLTAATDLDAGQITAAGAVTFQTDVDEVAAGNLAVGDVVKLSVDTVTAGTAGTFYARITVLGANSTTADVTGVLVASTVSGANSFAGTLAALTTWADDAGTNNASEQYDTHLRSYVKNVKLVDVDSGNTLASTATSEPFIAFSDDFDITSGQTRHLAVRADLDNSLVAVNAFKAGVDFTVASTIKDNDANQYVATTDVVAGNIAGKNMTVGAASLTVARASTPVSATKVKGAADVEILGVSLTAGSSSKDKLTSLVVRLLGDDDNTFNSGYGDTDASDLVSTVSLYAGTTKLSGPKALSSLTGTLGTDGYRTVTFDGLTYEIPAGTSQKLTVKADLKNTISATRYVVATIDPSSDVTALDADGNTLTISDTADGSVNENDADATSMNDTTPAVVITISTSGTLAAAVEGSPSSAIVVAGATNVVMAKYKFSALNEGFTINKLDVASDTDGTPDFTDDPTADTGNDNDIVRVGVRAGGVTTWSNLSGGKAGFSGLAIAVPSNGNVYVEILADLNTIADGATSGETPRLGVSTYATTNTFEAVGVGSSETKAIADVTFTAEANVKAMTLRKTAPTITKATGLTTALINGTNRVYGFTVAADAGAAVSMKRVALTMSTSAGITVSGVKVYRGSTDITGDVSVRNGLGQNLKVGGSNIATDGTAFSGVVYITWDKSATDEEVVSAGGSAIYYVDTTVSSAASTDSISTYIADDTVQMTSGAVSTLRTTIAANPETANASVNNTQAIFRAYDATHIYLDADNSGSYAATTDYLITAIDATTPYLLAAANTIIPGALRYTTTDVAGADGTAGVYFDIATTGAYDVATDPAFGVTVSTDAAPANNALMAFDVRYTTTGTTLYFDGTDGLTAANGTYAAGDDTVITDALMTEASSAPANNAQVVTSNANFIWSDNSNTSHTTSTTDWTNGYLVNDLATATLSLSY